MASVVMRELGEEGGLMGKIGICREFLLFLKEEKKWWLTPIVLVLLLLTTVIVVAEGSALAPFIYAIF